MRQIKKEKNENKTFAKKIAKEKKFLLKDVLFNKAKVEMLAGEIEKACLKVFAGKDKKNVSKTFQKEKFIHEVVAGFGERELKERIYHIRDMLHKYLSVDLDLNYLETLDLIQAALPRELDNTKTDGDYGDFIYAPYAEYVATYGLDKKYVKRSLEMLEEITKRFSSEFAVRAFWNEFEDETFKQFIKWSKSDKYHVRRLASEGSRPRLPWGKKINLHYTKTEQILDGLYCDKCRYVTRSVANHLNDISKIDEDFVMRKLKEWENSQKQNQKEMDFIINHATRSLRKNKK